MSGDGATRGIKPLIVALALIFFSAQGRADSVCARTMTTLRKGPGANHPVSWKVAKYTPFLRLQQKGSWTKVQDLEGEVHWARSSDLTGKMRCVSVKTAVALLHKDPNANSPPPSLKTLDRYTPLKRLEDDQEDWLHVEIEDGLQAWIHESQVWKPVTVNSISF